MEMRLNSAILVGRLVNDPIQAGNLIHFRLEAQEGVAPFHCIARGKAGENVLQYCRNGDEVSVEGFLTWMSFKNGPKPVLLIEARYVSYGRKKQSLRQGSYSW